jgi:lysophospholipase L1-like esterase
VASVAVVGAAFLLWVPARDPSESGSLVLVGDSLNVGTELYLNEFLEGWEVAADDLAGRSSHGGLAALAEARRAPGPIVVSLGTNDDPNDPEAFRTRASRLLDLVGPARCVVWATLWRDGEPMGSLNAVLAELARERPNLRLLDWAEMLRRHPDWLASDGTHGSPAGYRARAEEAARLVRACPVADEASPAGAAG